MQARNKLLTALLILWAVPEDQLEHFLHLNKPRLQDSATDVTIGRVTLTKIPKAAAGQVEGLLQLAHQ